MSVSSDISLKKENCRLLKVYILSISLSILQHVVVLYFHLYAWFVDYATVNFDLIILYTDVVKEHKNKLPLFIGQQLNSKVRA